jgi:hypothetical protein
MDSYTVGGLQESVEYEIFIQPFNSEGIVGLPSPLQLVKTHSIRPTVAPEVLEAKMINATAAFVAWNPLGEDDHNGPLLGYKVSSVIFYTFTSHFVEKLDISVGIIARLSKV